MDGSLVLQVIGYAGTFVVTVITTTWTVAWKLSSTKASLEKKISDAVTTLRDERVTSFEAARKERIDQIDFAIRTTGESMSGMRQKMIDVELWGRDNYVRRADFQNVVDGFTKSIERMNDKLDRVIQGIKDDRDDRDSR